MRSLLQTKWGGSAEEILNVVSRLASITCSTVNHIDPKILQNNYVNITMHQDTRRLDMRQSYFKIFRHNI